jgi:hypothetical protein
LSEVPAARGEAPAARLDGWLAALDLVPIARDDREGIVSRDFIVHGRRRRDIRLTLILAPAVGCLLWVHYAPPLSDGFRKTYRTLLHWNDELPFVKFAVGTDERIILTAELPAENVDGAALGLAAARLIAVCDLLRDESAGWLWLGGHIPEPPPGAAASAVLLRHEAQLGELAWAE